MSHQNSSVIVSPTVMEVVDDKHFISADEFSTASDWDALVATRGGDDAREDQPDADVSRFDGDSVYVKFEPLLCPKQLVEGGGGECFSNGFQSRMLPGQPPGGVASSPHNPDNRVDDSPSHSRKHSLAMGDAESSLYTTAVESSTNSFRDNLNETVILPNPTILVEKDEEVNGNIGGGSSTSADDNPDQLHDYEGFRNGLVTKNRLLQLKSSAATSSGSDIGEEQVRKRRAEQSVTDISFLEAFSKGVVVGTPEKLAVIINRTFEKSPEAQPSKLHELNGTFNIAPATPPESLNVTQILARHDELDEEEELDATETEEEYHSLPASSPIKDENEIEESLDLTTTPVKVLNMSFSEDENDNIIPNSNLTLHLPPEPEEPSPELLQHIQELKDRNLQLDSEYEQLCQEADSEVSSKEANLKTLKKQCEAEELEVQKGLTTLNLMREGLFNANENLNQAETKLAEMVILYEKAKGIHSKLQQNIDILQKRETFLAQALDWKDQREAAAHKVFKNSLQKMQQDFESRVKERETENMRLNARFRMVEMGLEQKEAKSCQLDIENSKLRALCDELLESNSNGAQ